MKRLLTILLLVLFSAQVSSATLLLHQPPVPNADAGPDRVAFVNEPLVLDGTGSTDVASSMRPNSDQYSIKWTFGIPSWDYMTDLSAPIAYPAPGVYNVTLTVCNASDVCDSDTATVTVSAITEGAETIVGDTGNNITNGTNLKAAITAATAINNPVITITAGVTYDFDGIKYDLPNRTGSGYLTLRTSAHAALPVGTNRVFPADASDLAIITPGDKAGFPAENSAEAAFAASMGATPGHHYRFLGIAFNVKFPTLSYNNPDAFIDLGAGGATSLTQLPHHIQVDRCAFNLTGNTTAQFTRGVVVRASDVAVVNSYLFRQQRTGADVQSILFSMGERLNVMNNFLNATTENFMSGGADIGIRITQDTAQATGNDATHIKLAASSSAVNDFYTDKGIYITSGTGAVSSVAPFNPGVTIVDYDGATKIATVSPAWTTIPNGTSVYRIGDHVPSFLVFRRNHLYKDPCWRPGASCNYGVNWVVKNSFESKQGRSWSVQGNFIENHWQEDQNWSVVLTVRNQDGRATLGNHYYSRLFLQQDLEHR